MKRWGGLSFGIETASDRPLCWARRESSALHFQHSIGDTGAYDLLHSPRFGWLLAEHPPVGRSRFVRARGLVGDDVPGGRSKPSAGERPRIGAGRTGDLAAGPVGIPGFRRSGEISITVVVGIGEPRPGGTA